MLFWLNRTMALDLLYVAGVVCYKKKKLRKGCARLEGIRVTHSISFERRRYQLYALIEVELI